MLIKYTKYYNKPRPVQTCINMENNNFVYAIGSIRNAHIWNARGTNMQNPVSNYCSIHIYIYIYNRWNISNTRTIWRFRFVVLVGYRMKNHPTWLSSDLRRVWRPSRNRACGKLQIFKIIITVIISQIWTRHRHTSLRV